MNKAIYVFFEGHFYGGAEKMLLWLSSGLYNDGYDIRICQIYDNVDLSDIVVPVDNLHLKFIPSYLIRNLKYFTLGIFKIISYIKKNNVQYVVSFGSNSFYLLGILKHILNYKLLVSERGYPPAKRFFKLRKILFEKADCCVFQTYGAKSYFDLEEGVKAFIIPNPVNLPIEEWSDAGKSNVFIFVGRLDLGHKRVDLLIDAFQKVLNIVPDSILRIVGNGYDEEKVKMMVKDRHLDKSVEFLGFKKDIIQELSSARVFVLCSDIEGMPNALLEAMAYGMPVISTDCSPGGAAYLLGNNENGLLVPKGNIDDLSNAMISLITDGSKRRRYANKARERVKSLNPSIILPEWEKVFEMLLK